MFSLDGRLGRRRGRRAAAGGCVSLAVAGVLVLAGCSGADDPGADAAESPSVSSMPTPSESRSPSPSAVYKPASAEGPAENVQLPVMPEEAKVESKEGLIAFARYWYDLVNYGFETGETKPVRAISGPDCQLCSHFYSGVEEAYSADGWLEGGTLEVMSIASEFAETPDTRRQVIASVRQATTNYRRGTGEIYYVGDAGEQAFPQLLEAIYVDGGWRMDRGETMRQ